MKKIDTIDQIKKKILIEGKTKRDKISETNSNLDELKPLARKQIESIMGKGKVISDIFCRVNEMCKPCKLLPICFGSCTRKVIDAKRANSNIPPFCQMRISDIGYKNLILNHYKLLLKNKDKSNYESNS
jgi:radical SAM protein with 4Fe4S-binding SPASM domain